MENKTGVCVAYVEDVMRAFNCSKFIAHDMMKKTGYCFKVGKKLAVPYKVFIAMQHGIHFETPEDFMRF